MHAKDLKILNAKKLRKSSKISWIYPHAGEIFSTFILNI